MNTSIENLLLKAIRIGIILSLFTPLVLGPFGLSFSEYPKALYFRVVVGVTVMLWMILLWFRPKYLPKINLLTGSVLLFVAVQFAASLFGFNFERSFWGSLETGGGLFNMLYFTAFFLLLVSMFQKKDEWLFLLRWVVGVSFLSILAGFLQKMGIAGFYGVSLSADRISGTLSNPVYFGAYLVMTISLAFYLLAVERKKDWKIIWAVVAALGFIALLMSGVRGAFSGFMFSLGVLAVLTFFFFVLAPSYPKLRRWMLGLAIAGSAALLLTVLFADLDFLASGSGLDRITAIFDSDAIKGRLPGWETAIAAWKDKPLLGWGYSSFGYLYDKYFDPHYYNYIHGYYVFFDAHGKILNLLAESGILGAASYLLIFGMVFYLLFRPLIKRGEFCPLCSEAKPMQRNTSQAVWQGSPSFLKRGNMELRDHPEASGHGASDFAEGKAVPIGASERAEDMSERARWASERVLQSVFPSAILISLFSGYFFQNMFAFDTISTYVVFFFLLAFVNNTYPVGAPNFLRGQLLNLVKQLPLGGLAQRIVITAVITIVITFMLWAMYFGNINPALASYDLVKGVMAESKDYAASIWYYRRAVERKTPYHRELLFMQVSRDVATLQDEKGRDEETRKLILQNLRVNTPLMMQYFGHPDIRYLNFHELLASSGEWQYLLTRDEPPLKMAYRAIDKALEFNDKWMQFYYLLGRLEVYQGNYEKAEEYFDRGFTLSRQDFVDIFNRYKMAGTAYGRIKDYKKSAESFRKAVDAMYVFLKHSAKPAEGTEVEARRRATKNDIAVFELTAWLHWQLGEKETALEIYRKALEVYPEWEIRLKKDLEKMKLQ